MYNGENILQCINIWEKFSLEKAKQNYDSKLINL